MSVNRAQLGPESCAAAAARPQQAIMDGVHLSGLGGVALRNPSITRHLPVKYQDIYHAIAFAPGDAIPLLFRPCQYQFLEGHWLMLDIESLSEKATREPQQLVGKLTDW
jgi:hypothetical protein